MKGFLTFSVLIWVVAAHAQYSTSFDSWPIMAEGNWSLSGPGGTYTSSGCYVNFGNENSGLRKVGFNTAGDALSLPKIDNPTNVSFWARTSSGSGASIEVQYFDGNAWVTAADHRIRSTSYDYYSADIDFIGPNVPLRLRMSAYGNSVFLDDLSVGAIILPVELATFTATDEGDRGVVMNWRTLTETDNLGFDIERSRDGITFEVIDHIPGAGTTVIPQDYSYRDPSPYSGLSYYRLNQIDFDGTSTYSELQSVRREDAQAIDLRLGSTLVANSLTIQTPNVAEGATLRIYDRNGNFLLETKGLPTAGDLTVDVSRLRSGLYFLQFIQNGAGDIRRFVKM